MTKHLSVKQVEDYQQRQLPPEDLLAADDHLAECSECRNVVRSPMNTAAVTVYADLASEISVAEHPSFEQKAAYVEGLLTGDARRMIEDHLASCAQCAPQVADLRTFRNQIAPEMDREFLPGDLAQGAKLQRKPDQSSRTLSPPLLKIPGWSLCSRTSFVASRVSGMGSVEIDHKQGDRPACCHVADTCSDTCSNYCPSPCSNTCTVVC